MKKLIGSGTKALFDMLFCKDSPFTVFGRVFFALPILLMGSVLAVLDILFLKQDSK